VLDRAPITRVTGLGELPLEQQTLAEPFSLDNVWTMANGEEEAERTGLAALLEAHRADLRRFLVARCDNPADADDLLQELWLRTNGNSSGPIANGRAYLFRMANNLVVDRARARQREMRRDRSWLERDGPSDGARSEPQDLSADIEGSLIEADEADSVRRAIAALPDGARRALLLYRFEGRKQAEIARIMGISRSGVEKHLALAMKRLRRSLKDCGFFDGLASTETGPEGDASGNGNSTP